MRSVCQSGVRQSLAAAGESVAAGLQARCKYVWERTRPLSEQSSGQSERAAASGARAVSNAAMTARGRRYTTVAMIIYTFGVHRARLAMANQERPGQGQC